MQFGLNHAARALIILLWTLVISALNPVLAQQLPAPDAEDPRLRVSHLREQYGKEIHKRNWSSALPIADEAVQIAEHKLVPYDPLFGSLLGDRAGILESLNQLERAKSDRVRSNEIWTRLAEFLMSGPGTRNAQNTINSINRASVFALCPRPDLVCAVAEGLSSFGYWVERYQQMPYSEQLLDKGFAIAQLMPDERSEEKTLVLGNFSRLYWQHNRLKARLASQAYLAAASKAKDQTLYAHALVWASKLAMLEYDPLHARKYAKEAVDIELAYASAPDAYLCSCLEQEATAEEAAGNIASAIGLFEQTLRLRPTGDSNSLEKSSILDSLSTLFCLQGDVKKARICFDLSLKSKSSPDHSGENDKENLLQPALLGWIEHLEGDQESARTHLKAVISELAKVGQDTYGTYTQLAAVDASLNNWTEAQHDSLEAAHDFSRVINRQLTTLLLNEQISLINDQAKPIIGDLISCAARSKNGQIYASILPFKGLLFDRLKRNSQLRAYISTRPDLQKLVEEIRNKDSRLALIRLEESAGGESEIVGLTQEKVDCERALAAATLDVPLLRTLSGEESLKILDSLGADETFVDIYKYKELDSKQVVYSAFISRAHTPVQMIALGGADPLETACRNWLASMRDGHTIVQPSRVMKISGTRSIGIKSFRAECKLSESAARETVQSVLAPLLRALQSSPKCVLSLDGDTFRLPWQLLLPVGAEVTEVDSVNQLVGRAKDDLTSERSQKLMLVGDVKYQDEPELAATKTEDSAIKEVAAATKIAVLPIEGAAATLSAVLKSLPECSYAHLATHGYFIDKKIEDSAELTQHFNTKNVLQDAGLLLADEPVTAGDLAEIDLSRCNQVVLSACETGIGETTFTGQGILGLRAALTASGAKTLLVSLWKVDDQATSELMKLYYENLWELKQSPSQALTVAQKRLGELKAEWKQPYYWAGWILVGKTW